MIQYLVIGVLFVAAVTWIVFHSVKSLSARNSCNKGGGCAEVKK